MRTPIIANEGLIRLMSRLAEFSVDLQYQHWLYRELPEVRKALSDAHDDLVHAAATIQAAALRSELEES